MISLFFFIAFIFIGVYLKKMHPCFVDEYLSVLHKVTWYNLLLLVFVQFGKDGIDVASLPLIEVGFLLHIVPASLAFAIRNLNEKTSKYLLAYSTFGGGNRGVLALAVLSPAMLPHFLIADVGIFLSLYILALISN